MTEKPDPTAEMIASIAAAYAARPDTGIEDIVRLVARLRDELGAGADTPAAHPPAPRFVPAARPAQPVAPAPAHMSAPRAAVPPAADDAAPALPLSQAVTRDKVYCLCCGKGFKMLKRHLGTEHGMTEDQYRRHFGLPEDMPLVAPSYSERKARHAREVGLGKYARIGA
ncbi:MucR family transcriptional regulator [Frigidibacter sp. MR17.24]|uniref:MucR family transcriptional regulator n=1 Tax=Frigidibacter sp. MR17.24 TaxID=3127345 RepID=UPI003012B338